MTTLQLPAIPTPPKKNDAIPVLACKRKFEIMTHALDELKYVKRTKDLNVQKCQEDNDSEMEDSKE